MKRSILKAFCLAALITAAQFCGCTREPWILLFVRDGSSDFKYMLTREVGVMKSMLEENRLPPNTARCSPWPAPAC